MSVFTSFKATELNMKYELHMYYKQVLATLSDQELKAQIFDSCVLPLLCYTTETWAPTQRTLVRIPTAHRAMERRVMGVSLLRQCGLNTVAD